MTNPFDLRGPEFLVFYIALGALVTLAVAIMRRQAEPLARTTAPLTDYLKIAYLRGGPSEALRIATVALLDRGLMEMVDEHRLKATPDKMPAGLPRTEQRVLENCKTPTRASAIVDDTSLRITVQTECEAHLVQAGLLPDENVRTVHKGLVIGGLLLLGLVALVKIMVALGRGRTNIWFLILAATAFGFIVFRLARPFRTAAGEAMLADLRRLFSAARHRTAPVGAPSGTNEAALLAAVFGIGAFGERLFRRPEPVRSSRSSGCGSGGFCGSGSSCGSACGGGCGGGCGGCGS